MEYNIIQNKEESRFELELEGKLAMVEYIEDTDRITFTHTEVPDALSGRGIAAALAKHALAYASAHNLKVIPLCPYIKGYMQKHGLL